jgi:hypothetical protein
MAGEARIFPARSVMGPLAEPRIARSHPLLLNI